MKIRTNRAALADALTWTAAAISRRPVTPALSGVRLTAAADVLTLAAFDYETSHEARVSVEVAGDGDCLVAGHFLREVVSALKGETVELVLDGPRLEISSGRSTYRIAAMALEDFPNMPGFPTPVGTVAADDLAAVVGTIEHAADRNGMVPILGAAHLAAGDTLAGTATDRFRIARRAVPWSGDKFEANVPVVTLAGALKGLSGDLTIGHAGGMLGLSDSRRRVTLRCLADDFPVVDKFLGVDPDLAVEVDARDLAEAVKRATMASSEHQIVRLAIGGGEVAVTADSETSEGAEFVECSEGERVVNFNGAYLASALLAAETERVRLGFNGSDAVRPVSIIPIDGPDLDIVVMPRRAS